MSKQLTMAELQAMMANLKGEETPAVEVAPTPAPAPKPVMRAMATPNIPTLGGAKQIVAAKPKNTSGKPKYDLDMKDEFETIPAGEYHVEVVGMKADKSNKGLDKVSLTFKIVDGDYSGRRVFDNIHIETHMGAPIHSGLRKMKQVVKALANTDLPKQFEELSELNPYFNQCAGKIGKIYLSYEDGKDDNVWARVKLI